MKTVSAESTIHIVAFEPPINGYGGVGGFFWFLSREDARKEFYSIIRNCEEGDRVALWSKKIPTEMLYEDITEMLECMDTVGMPTEDISGTNAIIWTV